MEIIFNILKDFSKLLIPHLKAIQNLKKIKIEDKSPQELILLAIDMVYFFLDSMPRKIFYSEDFFCPDLYRDNLQELISKIEIGDNIAPYQRMYKRTPDYCWYDWGIYHFHLGKIQSGEVNRTGKLLYAYVDNKSVYCLEINDHKKLNDGQLLSTLHKNFPHVLENKKLIGIQPSMAQVSNENIKNARKKGMSLLYPIPDGTVYAPIQGGYSCNGASTKGVMYLNRLIKEINQIVNTLQNYEFQGFDPIMNLLLLNCNEYFFVFKEENTGKVFRIKTEKNLAGELLSALKIKVQSIAM